MHEQSETLTVENGQAVNVYGQGTPQAGQPLPQKYAFEKPVYPTEQEAIGAAIVRSDLEGQAIEKKRNKLINDPRFRILGPDDQQDILRQRDPVFSHATPQEQQLIFQTIREQIIKGAVKDYSSPPVVDASKGQPEEQTKEITGQEVTDNVKKGIAEVAGVGTETAGGVAGGIRGAAAGARFGTAGAVVGGVLGAAGGSAAGTVARQPLDIAAGKPFPEGKELIEDVVKSAAAGAAGELGGRAIIGAWNKAVYEPLGRYLTTGSIKKGGGLTAEQQVLDQQAEKAGIVLRPSELTGEDSAGMVEQTVRRSIFGRRYFDNLDVYNEAALRKNLDDLTGRFIRPESISQLEAGSLLQDTLKNKSTPLFRAAESQYYKRVKDLAGADEVTVDGGKILPDVKKLLETVDPQIQPSAHALLRKMEGMLSEEVVTQSAPKGSGIPTKSKTVAKQLDWMDAQDMRSMLLEVGRSKELLKDREQGLANQAAGKLMGAMEQTAKSAGSDVYALWRQAQEFSKKGHDLLNDATIKRIATVYPEDAANILFKKDAITENKRLVEALSYAGDEASTNAMNAYRRAAMDKLIRDSSTDGFLTGRRLYNAIYGKNGIGEAMMKAVFPPEYLTELNKTLDVAKRLNMSESAGAAGNTSQTGRSLVNWFEQSMLINIPADFAKHALKGEFGTALANAAANIQQAGVYVFSMKEVGDILNSPEGLRILRDGLQIGEKGQQAWKVAGQLLGHVLKDSTDTIKEVAEQKREPVMGETMTPPPMGNQP